MEISNAIERCTPADVGLNYTDETPQALKDRLEDYFGAFAKPVRRKKDGGMMYGDVECLKCGAALCGFLGSFTWGFAHGEGFCSHEGCGWPGRLYHYLKDEDGEDLFDGPFQTMLQYHPDDVERGEVMGMKFVEGEHDGKPYRGISCSHDLENVIHEDGEINWAAAFGADDGVGHCDKCAHLRGGETKWVGYHPCWHGEAPDA